MCVLVAQYVCVSAYTYGMIVCIDFKLTKLILTARALCGVVRAASCAL